MEDRPILQIDGIENMFGGCAKDPGLIVCSFFVGVRYMFFHKHSLFRIEGFLRQMGISPFNSTPKGTDSKLASKVLFETVRGNIGARRMRLGVTGIQSPKRLVSFWFPCPASADTPIIYRFRKTNLKMGTESHILREHTHTHTQRSKRHSVNLHLSFLPT